MLFFAELIILKSSSPARKAKLSGETNAHSAPRFWHREQLQQTTLLMSAVTSKRTFSAVAAAGVVLRLGHSCLHSTWLAVYPVCSACLSWNSIRFSGRSRSTCSASHSRFE